MWCLGVQFNDSVSDLDRATPLHGGNAPGGNWSVLVVDSQRVRRVTFPAAYAQIFWGKQARFRAAATNATTATTFGHSSLHGVTSSGTVHTVAGQAFEGAKDGEGSEAAFNDPAGVAVDASGRVFVADAGTCRVRRLTYANQVGAEKALLGRRATDRPSGGLCLLFGTRRFRRGGLNKWFPCTFSWQRARHLVASALLRLLGWCHLHFLQVAQRIGCSTSAVAVVRPSGCGSYDPPVDARDLAVSPAFGNVYYNYGQRFDANRLDGSEPAGRSVRNCVGAPPPDKLDKRFWHNQSDNLVVDDGRVDVNEDTQV